jgi:hypothetical protein
MGLKCDLSQEFCILAGKEPVANYDISGIWVWETFKVKEVLSGNDVENSLFPL